MAAEVLPECNTIRHPLVTSSNFPMIIPKMDLGSLEELLADTLDLLEWRLQKLEFVVHGDINRAAGAGNTDTTQQPSIHSRIQKLEHSLQQIAIRSEVAKELVKLQSRFPELFESTDVVGARGSAASAAAAGQQTEPDSAQKLSMVLAEAPAYSGVASQLRHLDDVPVPGADAFAKIVGLRPRMEQLRRRQYAQAMEVSELRRRSAALVLQWHEVFILGQGRCWAEWDTKLRQAERAVRREEVRRMRQEG